jgi:hypothetical protein
MRRRFLAMRGSALLLAAAALTATSTAHAQEYTDIPKPLRGFGVSTHLNRPGWNIDALVARMTQLGVSTIRDEISWGRVEQAKGVYAITPRDEEWIRKVSSQGIKIIVVLDYGNKLYATQNDPAGLDADAFARYAAWMARYFKGKNIVAAFELWNEPNNFYFRKQYGGEWNGKGDAPWIEKFARFVEKASAAIKKEDPTTPIITGCGVPPASLYMLRRFPEAFKNIDGLTEHPYGYRLPSESVPWGGEENEKRDGISVAYADRSLLSLLRTEREASQKALGRELPIYITELGYSTYREQGQRSLYAGFTEETQAVYHTRSLILGLAYGARYWCLYDLLNDGTNALDPEQNFGLFRANTFEPKPVVASVRGVVRLLGPNWKFLSEAPGKLEVKIEDPRTLEEWTNPPGEKPLQINGPQIFWFQVPEGYVSFVWKAGRRNVERTPMQGKVTFTGPAATSATVTDLLTGKQQEVKAATGKSVQEVTVPVSGEPVAILWRTTAK